MKIFMGEKVWLFDQKYTKPNALGDGYLTGNSIVSRVPVVGKIDEGSDDDAYLHTCYRNVHKLLFLENLWSRSVTGEV